jgi:hypothetical protein
MRWNVDLSFYHDCDFLVVLSYVVELSLTSLLLTLFYLIVNARCGISFRDAEGVNEREIHRDAFFVIDTFVWGFCGAWLLVAGVECSGMYVVSRQ